MEVKHPSSQERGLIILIGIALLASGIALFLSYHHKQPSYTTGPIVLHDVSVIAPVFTEVGKINVNCASAAELERLPGIGEVLAERIVAYRQEHGPFASIDELVKVRGIGEDTIERIREYAEAR